MTAPYKASEWILIEHPKTGERYGIPGSAFGAYEELGFRAISYESGAPFELTDEEKEAATAATAAVGPAGVAPEPKPKPAASVPGSAEG